MAQWIEKTVITMMIALDPKTAVRVLWDHNIGIHFKAWARHQTVSLSLAYCLNKREWLTFQHWLDWKRVDIFEESFEILKLRYGHVNFCQNSRFKKDRRLVVFRAQVYSLTKVSYVLKDFDFVTFLYYFVRVNNFTTYHLRVMNNFHWG